MNCAYCGKKISILRKLQDQEFCSAAHRQAFNQREEELAVEFLRQSRPRYRADAAPAAAAPVEVPHRSDPDSPPQELSEVLSSKAQAVPEPVLAEEPARVEPVPALASFQTTVIAMRIVRARLEAAAEPVPTPVASLTALRLGDPPITQPRFAMNETAPAAVPAAVPPDLAARAEPGPALAGFHTNAIAVRTGRAGLAVAAEPVPVAPSIVVCQGYPPVQQPRFARCEMLPAAVPCRSTLIFRRAYPVLPAPLASAPPLFCPPYIHPLWLERSAQKKSRASGAGFISLRVTWNSPASKVFCPSAVRDFPASPEARACHVSPHFPALHLRERFLTEAAVLLYQGRTGGALAVPETTAVLWPDVPPVLQPDPALPLRGSLALRLCGPLDAALPPARTPSVPSTFAAVHESGVCQGPLLPPGIARQARPILRSAPSFPIGSAAAIPAQSPPSQPCEQSLTAWKWSVLPGEAIQIQALAPNFRRARESLEAMPADEQFPRPSADLPLSHFQPFEPGRARSAWLLARSVWSAVPGWSRALAIWLPVSALALAGAFRLSTSSSARSTIQSLQSQIARRSAVELDDDFRSGLSRWTGASGWTQTWSYDSTGFARPGKLALLSGTERLADYRLEFTGEIGRKALGWVFRASSPNDYYAMKIVQSKRTGVAAYSLLRYAVIGGHEQAKAQLPLPVTDAGRRLLRVRDEVRGASFTLYIDGQVADVWSDNSLVRGGVGFFSDPGETSYIRWVDVAYQDDFLGRLCSYLSPSNSR